MKRKYKIVVIVFRCNEWQIGHTIGGLFNQIGSYPTKEAAIEYCNKSILKYKIIDNHLLDI